MAREVYNEGRVVGQSVYELYVKHALSENPDIEPATEREWLAATLGNGQSLLLKINPDDLPTPSNDSELCVVTYDLPEDSKLCAAGSIIASLFFGEGYLDSLYSKQFAKAISSYQSLIQNTNKQTADNFASSTDGKTYPYSKSKNDSEYTDLIVQYVKIQDGVVIQPGSWATTSLNEPKRILDPNLHVKPAIRLRFAEKPSKSFWILLTGFASRDIISGITKTDGGAWNTEHPENGDFIGPEVYPWANKIIFTYPQVASYYFRQGMKSTYLNLDINKDSDSIDTVFTASYLKPSPGISIDGPRTSGGDIKIGAKIGLDANKFIKVDQTTSTTDEAVVTTLTHSPVTPGNGIAMSGPITAGGPIDISSIISVDANKCLKVTQTASTTKNASTTTLKASKTVSRDDSGVTVNQPSEYGGDTYVSAPMESTNQVYLKITQANGKTTFKPITFLGDGYIKIETKVGSDGETHPYLSLDLNKIAKTIIVDTSSPLNNLINQILQKIGDGKSAINSSGNINWGGTASSPSKIAVGNMNVYSSSNGSSQDRWIKTNHGSVADGDLRVN